jgi:hypothetical protein
MGGGPIPSVRNLLIGFMFALVAGSAGCEQEPKNPYDISIDQRSTALRIPDRVERVSKRLREREEKAKQLIASMPSGADKVSDPTDWDVVLEIVSAADTAGKDGAHAAEVRELTVTIDFFQDEHDEIAKKIGGAVDYAAKQKTCEVDAWGAVNAGLKKGFEERIEERLKQTNDSFLLIERHEDALGKKNVPVLEQLAFEVSQASFVVHVAMPEAKLELEAMVTASAAAREHIKRTLEEENAPPKQAGKSSPEGDKNRRERVKRAEAQLVKVDQAEIDAKKNLEDLEQRTKDLKSSYDDALAKLKDAAKAKKK